MASEHTSFWPEHPENGLSTCTAETAVSIPCSQLPMPELVKWMLRWALRAYIAARTTLERCRALPEWSGHVRAILSSAADWIGGKRHRGGSGWNWGWGLRLLGRKELCFHRAQSIWEKVEGTVRIWLRSSHCVCDDHTSSWTQWLFIAVAVWRSSRGRGWHRERMLTTSEEGTVREITAWMPPRQKLPIMVAAGEVPGWTQRRVPRMRLSTPTLSVPYCTRTRTAAARILAQRGRRRWGFVALAIWSSCSTVPWKVTFRQPDRGVCRAHNFQFCIATRLPFSSKVVE
jgi:hypothetical protein